MHASSQIRRTHVHAHACKRAGDGLVLAIKNTGHDYVCDGLLPAHLPEHSYGPCSYGAYSHGPCDGLLLAHLPEHRRVRHAVSHRYGRVSASPTTHLLRGYSRGRYPKRPASAEELSNGSVAHAQRMSTRMPVHTSFHVSPRARSNRKVAPERARSALSDATLRFDLALGVRRRHAPKVAKNRPAHRREISRTRESP